MVIAYIQQALAGAAGGHGLQAALSGLRPRADAAPQQGGEKYQKDSAYRGGRDMKELWERTDSGAGALYAGGAAQRPEVHQAEHQ